MQILILGSQGTGKSTLAKDFVEMHPEYILIDGIVREAKVQGLISGVNQEMTSEDSVKLLHDYLVYVGEFVHHNRLTWDTARKKVVSVYGVLRFLAYASHFFGSYSQVAKNIKRLVFIDSLFYDMFVYLPVEFPAEETDIRSGDESYCAAIDERILSLLKEYHISYVTINGSPEERFRQLEEVVNENA